MKDQLAIRKALVVNGLRTFAYRFDGAGDSGSLESLLFPDDLTRPLDGHDDMLENSFVEAMTHTLVDGKWQSVPSASYAAAQGILGTVPLADQVLDDMAYSALEHFDGDWVNNDGGYGIVAVDLLTGQFKIEGYQRYTDTTSADSDGTCFEVLDIDQPLDLTTHLKSTLNIR